VRVRFENNQGLVLLSPVTPAVTIDAGALAEGERRALEQLVRDARFFDLPARVPAARGVPSHRWDITIEESGRQHSISVSDPVQGPALRRLVDRLREHGRKSEV
jgi:emfourin